GYLALVYPASKTLGSDFAKYSFLWNLINQKIRPAVESSDLFYDMEFLYLYDLFRGEYQATFSSEKTSIHKIKKMMTKELESVKFSPSFFQKTKDHFLSALTMKKDSLDDLSSLAVYLLNPSNQLIRLEDEIKSVEETSLVEIERMKADIFKKSNRYSYVLK
ncbi:MAG: hypothetical protein R6V40_01330, partial [Candidatus Moraniibacteriota bacterium]